MTYFENILILAPHTDDAELGCGGTMARLMEEGRTVSVAAFSTARESLPEGSYPNQLEDEFRKAMALAGIPAERIFVYDYAVRKLSYSRQEVLEELVKLKKEVAPDTVLLPSGNDLHQDHQVVFAEGVRAFKNITVWGYELPWNHIDFSAQAFVTLEERHLEKKWELLQVYESQIKKGRRYFDMSFLKGLASVRGLQVNAVYAEAFEVIRNKW